MGKMLVGPVAKGVLTDGTAHVVSVAGAHMPLSVWVDPAEGDTVTVEYRMHPDAPWVDWAKGDVTDYADDVLDGPVDALRFTSAIGLGSVSAYGVA